VKAIKTEINSLLEFVGNPRKGNVKALVESLQTNGQYRPIIVQKSTRQILAGNHLWKAAKEIGWTEIDIIEVDVDDKQAKRIVATDNRLSDMGTYDEQALLDLLKDIDLHGTGYITQDIDDLLVMIEERSAPDWRIGNDVTHQEGVSLKPTLAERAQRYQERTIRLLMLELPNMHYVWAIEHLTQLREEFNVDSNADAILRVLAEYTGTEIPT